jgi:hypothetical protein
MSRRLLAFALAACIPAASAQTVFTYTQSQTGPNLLTYGLPVPQPIDSVTPVDGFRSYASLDARLQSLALESSDLSAHDVGRTIAGRTVWAYVASDEDGTDVEGRAEAAFFINASTHAREWGTPEISTGTIERLMAGATDRAMVRYVLDNTRLVIIPVHNIDGFLQTQRYPTQVVVGQDPTASSWPRDGRMRRKNMRGADENLLTFGDHLNGIDLNRNHPPFWATFVGNGGSSANPNSLVFHGTAPHSEPENVALRAAAQLGPTTRYRLGIDVHSFSRVFFSSNTARTRLNGIQASLIERLRSHHIAVAGKNYNNVPDPPNQGIGTAAEYFAYEWLVPAWTLEIEPLESPVEYGGFNVNHGGFILPASQARRVREGWAESHLVAFYMMAGPPHLQRVRIYDAQNNALVRETRWQYDAASGRRQRVTALDGALQRNARYRVELAFSKPMRHRHPSGGLIGLPGAETLPLGASVALLNGSTRTPLDTLAGTWLTDEARVLRYRDDTFAFEFTAPDAIADLQLEVDVTDMVGHRLDSDPSTPVDWEAGAWSEWEDNTGADGDFGGADRSTVVKVGQTNVLELIAQGSTGSVVGEGDSLTYRFRRIETGPERVDLVLVPPNGDLSPAPVTVASWAPGEGGERTVTIGLPDDLVARADSTLAVWLDVAVGQTVPQTFRLAPTHLDNDAADLGVVRVRTSNGLVERWNELRTGPVARQAVLDGSLSYGLPILPLVSPDGGQYSIDSTLGISGNGATLSVGSERVFRSALDVSAGGRATVDNVEWFIHPPAQTPQGPVLTNAGVLTLSRSKVTGSGDLRTAFARSSGTLRIERSQLDSLQLHDMLHITGGQADIVASTFSRNQGTSLGYSPGASPRFGFVTAIDNGLDFLTFTWEQNPGPAFHHTLLQDNVVSRALSPPVLENCSGPASQADNSIENYSRCAFADAASRSNLDLGDFAYDAQLGGYRPIGVAIDGGAASGVSECRGVDQRGAPRPQTLVAGAVPRCDIGAIELGVNPYRGIWQPARSGHGVELHTSGNQLLLVWYTYGDDGQPTSYQAAAPLTGRHWEADLLLPRRNPQTGVVTAPRVGRVSIDFAADDDATLGWRFDARGTDGSERIRPAVFAAGAPRFEVSGVWYPPAESGYGATVSRRGEVTAVVLYYYDAAGNIRWVLGSSNGADALSIPMSSFTGFCPDCNAATMPVQFQPAGNVVVHFQTPTRARLDTSITYPGAAGGSWNRQRAALVPLNDPVDNP